jgi:hypothetical protein
MDECINIFWTSTNGKGLLDNGYFENLDIGPSNKCDKNHKNRKNIIDIFLYK